MFLALSDVLSHLASLSTNNRRFLSVSRSPSVLPSPITFFDVPRGIVRRQNKLPPGTFVLGFHIPHGREANVSFVEPIVRHLDD